MRTPGGGWVTGIISPGTIDKLAADLSQYGIAWLEEPLPPEDHEGYRQLKNLDLVPDCQRRA